MAALVVYVIVRDHEGHEAAIHGRTFGKSCPR